MNKNGLKYFLNTLLSFYFLLSFIIPDFVQAVESHVGEIRHSILTRAQFRELYGEEWDLMQGQAIEADSELLQLWGKEHVPDARWLFLRGCNNGRGLNDEGVWDGKDTYANPDQTACGDSHMDCFGLHNHGGGDHRHPLYCEIDAIRNPNGGQRNTMAWWPPKNSRWDTESSGAIIASEGGNETRPKCLTVNIFIKTKESAPGGAAQSTQAMTPEALREMIRRPEIRGEIETIFRELIRGNH